MLKIASWKLLGYGPEVATICGNGIVQEFTTEDNDENISALSQGQSPTLLQQDAMKISKKPINAYFSQQSACNAALSLNRGSHWGICHSVILTKENNCSAGGVSLLPPGSRWTMLAQACSSDSLVVDSILEDATYSEESRILGASRRREDNVIDYPLSKTDREKCSDIKSVLDKALYDSIRCSVDLIKMLNDLFHPWLVDDYDTDASFDSDSDSDEKDSGGIKEGIAHEGNASALSCISCGTELVEAAGSLCFFTWDENSDTLLTFKDNINLSNVTTITADPSGRRKHVNCATCGEKVGNMVPPHKSFRHVIAFGPRRVLLLGGYSSYTFIAIHYCTYCFTFVSN